MPRKFDTWWTPFLFALLFLTNLCCTSPPPGYYLNPSSSLFILASLLIFISPEKKEKKKTVKILIVVCLRNHCYYHFVSGNCFSFPDYQVCVAVRSSPTSFLAGETAAFPLLISGLTLKIFGPTLSSSRTVPPPLMPQITKELNPTKQVNTICSQQMIFVFFFFFFF